MLYDRIEYIPLHRWSPKRAAAFGARLVEDVIDPFKYQKIGLFNESDLYKDEEDEPGRNYQIIFDDEYDFTQYSDEDDDHSDKDDSTLISRDITEKERISLRDVNNMASTIFRAKDQIRITGRACILRELTNLSNLSETTVEAIDSWNTQLSKLVDFVKQQTTLRCLTLKVNDPDIYETRIPENFALAVASHPLLRHLDIQIAKWRPPLQVRNQRNWIQDILRTAKKRANFSLTLNVPPESLSLALYSAMISFSQQLGSGLKTLTLRCENLALPILQISSARGVIDELHLSSAFSFSTTDLAQSLASGQGYPTASCESIFPTEPGYPCKTHKSINFALEANKLRVRHLYLHDGCRAYKDQYLSRFHCDSDPTGPYIDNQYIESFHDYCRYPIPGSASHLEKLHRTCRRNTARRKTMDREVHLLLREAYVLFFATKRPRWLLPEIAAMVIRRRIKELGFVGEDAETLFQLCGQNDGDEKRATFVRTCVIVV